MKGKNNEARSSLWCRVRRACADFAQRGSRAELVGCRHLTLQGCDAILDYGRECIRLSVKDPDVCEVIICGKDLVCLSYHPDAVLVQGVIYGITLCRDKNRGTEERST